MSALNVGDPINDSDDSIITPHVRLNEKKDNDEESSRICDVVMESKKKQEWNKVLRNSCIDPVAFTLLNEKLHDLESLLEHDRLKIRPSMKESSNEGKIKDIGHIKTVS